MPSDKQVGALQGEQEHYKERADQGHDRTIRRSHMVNREFLQDGGHSPQSRGSNCQLCPWPVQQHAQRCQQPGARLFYFQQVRAEHDHCYPEGLPHTGSLSQQEPGDEQRKSRIEGQKGTGQRGIRLRECRSREERRGPIEDAPAPPVDPD